MPLLRSLGRLLALGGPAALAIALSIPSPALAAPAAKAAPGSAEHGAGQQRAGKRTPSKQRVARRDTGRTLEQAGARTKGREKDGDKKAGQPDKRKPLSIGAPNRGRLEGAVQLRSSRHVKVRKGARAWGLPVLVKALRSAAFEVAKKHGDSALLVGDLSAKTGGRLDGHNSHQSGRDADVGFYAVNAKGKTLRLDRFVAFDAKGDAIGLPGVRFDDKRNWALVEALLKNRQARVKYLFVTDSLKARLLAYAKKRGVPEELRARAAAAMMSPKHADLHNDHFHIRLACPPSMRGTCIEESFPRPGFSEDDVYPKEVPAPAGADCEGGVSRGSGSDGAATHAAR